MKKPFVTREQLEEITAKYPTPFHLYDEKGMRENARRLAAVGSEMSNIAKRPAYYAHAGMIRHRRDTVRIVAAFVAQRIHLVF